MTEQAWSGPWADDVRRILQLLQLGFDDLEQGVRAEPEPASGAESADPAGRAGHSPECRHCPLCQGAALLRRAGPDILDQVSEFTAGLAATLRRAQSDLREHPAAATGRSGAETPWPGSEPGRPGPGASAEPGEPVLDPPVARDGCVHPGTVSPGTVRIVVTD